jgi:hypothetical protein
MNKRNAIEPTIFSIGVPTQRIIAEIKHIFLPHFIPTINRIARADLNNRVSQRLIEIDPHTYIVMISHRLIEIDA